VVLLQAQRIIPHSGPVLQVTKLMIFMEIDTSIFGAKLPLDFLFKILYIDTNKFVVQTYLPHK